MAKTPATNDWRKGLSKKARKGGAASGSWRQPGAAFEPTSTGPRNRLLKLGGASVALLLVLAALWIILRRQPPSQLAIDRIGFSDYDDSLPAQPFVDGDSETLASLGEAIDRNSRAQSGTTNEVLPLTADLSGRDLDETNVVVCYVKAFAMRQGGVDGELLLLTDNARAGLSDGGSIRLGDLIERLGRRYRPRTRKLIVLDIAGMPYDWRSGQLGTGLMTRSALDKLSAIPNAVVLLPDNRTGESYGSHSFGASGRTAFMQFFDAALRGASDGIFDPSDRDGEIRVSEVVGYLRRQMRQWTFQNRQDERQPIVRTIPDLRDVPGADFVVLRYGSRAQTLEPVEPRDETITAAEQESLRRLRDHWTRLGPTWTERADKAIERPLLVRSILGRLHQAEQAWIVGQTRRCDEHLKRADAALAELNAGETQSPLASGLSTRFFAPYFRQRFGLEEPQDDDRPVSVVDAVGYHLGQRSLSGPLQQSARASRENAGPLQRQRQRLVAAFDVPWEVRSWTRGLYGETIARARRAEDLTLAGGDDADVRGEIDRVNRLLAALQQRAGKVAEAIAIEQRARLILPGLARMVAAQPSPRSDESNRLALLAAVAKLGGADEWPGHPDSDSTAWRPLLRRQSGSLPLDSEALGPAVRTLEHIADVQTIDRMLADGFSLPTDDRLVAEQVDRLSNRALDLERSLRQQLDGVRAQAQTLSGSSEQVYPRRRQEILAILEVDALDGDLRGDLLEMLREIEMQLLVDEAAAITVEEVAESRRLADEAAESESVAAAAPRGGAQSEGASPDGEADDRSGRRLTESRLGDAVWNGFWLTQTLSLASPDEVDSLVRAWSEAVVAVDQIAATQPRDQVAEAAVAVERFGQSVRDAWRRQAAAIATESPDGPSDTRGDWSDRRGADLTHWRRRERQARSLLAFDAETLKTQGRQPVVDFRRMLLASRLLDLAELAHADFWAKTGNDPDHWFVLAGQAATAQADQLFRLGSEPEWCQARQDELKTDRKRLSLASRPQAVTLVVQAGTVRVGGARQGGTARLRVRTDWPQPLDGVAGVHLVPTLATRGDRASNPVRTPRSQGLDLRPVNGSSPSGGERQVAFPLELSDDAERSGDCEEATLRPFLTFRGHEWRTDSIVAADPCRKSQRQLAWALSDDPASLRVTGQDEYKVLFVLDCSDSMKKTILQDGVRTGDTRMKAAKEALAEAVRSLPDSADAGLMLYGHRIAVRGGKNRRGNDDKWPVRTGEPTSAVDDFDLVVPTRSMKRNKQRMLDALEKVEPYGITPLLGALGEALREFDQQQDGRPAIVVLVTDGIPLDVPVEGVGATAEQLSTFRQRVDRVKRLLGSRNIQVVIVEYGDEFHRTLSADSSDAIRKAGYREFVDSLEANHPVRVLVAPERADLRERLTEAFVRPDFSLVGGQSKTVRDGVPIGTTVSDLPPGSYRLRIGRSAWPIHLSPGQRAEWFVDFGGGRVERQTSQRAVRLRKTEQVSGLDPVRGDAGRFGDKVAVKEIRYRSEAATGDATSSNRRDALGTLVVDVLLDHDESESSVLRPKELVFLVRGRNGLVPERLRVRPLARQVVPGYTVEADGWDRDEGLVLDVGLASQTLQPDVTRELSTLLDRGWTDVELPAVADEPPQLLEMKAVRRGAEVTVQVQTRPDGERVDPLPRDAVELFHVRLGELRRDGTFQPIETAYRVSATPDDGQFDITFESVEGVSLDSAVYSVGLSRAGSLRERLSWLRERIEIDGYDVIE